MASIYILQSADTDLTLTTGEERCALSWLATIIMTALNILYNKSIIFTHTLKIKVKKDSMDKH